MIAMVRLTTTENCAKFVRVCYLTCVC